MEERQQKIVALFDEADADRSGDLDRTELVRRHECVTDRETTTTCLTRFVNRLLAPGQVNLLCRKLMGEARVHRGDFEGIDAAVCAMDLDLDHLRVPASVGECKHDSSNMTRLVVLPTPSCLTGA